MAKNLMLNICLGNIFHSIRCLFMKVVIFLFYNIVKDTRKNNSLWLANQVAMHHLLFLLELHSSAIKLTN